MNRRKTWKVAVVAFSISILMIENASAEETVRPFYCAMDAAEAAKSPDCLRYHMECQTLGSGEVAPIFESLTFAQRANFFYEASALIAAKNCVHFSYQESLSAVQLHHVDELK